MNHMNVLSIQKVKTNKKPPKKGCKQEQALFPIVIIREKIIRIIRQDVRLCYIKIINLSILM